MAETEEEINVLREVVSSLRMKLAASGAANQEQRATASSDETNQSKLAFKQQHADDLEAIAAFWKNETQENPNMEAVRTKHVRGPNCNHLFCKHCSNRKGSCTCTFVQRPGLMCNLCGECTESSSTSASNGSKHAGCMGVFEECCLQCLSADCDCAAFQGANLCVCQNSECGRPRPRVVVEGAPQCECTKFNTECSPPTPTHDQMRSNAAMYEIFKNMHPEIAEHCSLTTFMSLRPWWVVMPTHRTCTCTYHNQMKIALEDAARSYNDLHSKCGGEGGCVRALRRWQV